MDWCSKGGARSPIFTVLSITTRGQAHHHRKGLKPVHREEDAGKLSHKHAETIPGVSLTDPAKTEYPQQP